MKLDWIRIHPEEWPGHIYLAAQGKYDFQVMRDLKDKRNRWRYVIFGGEQREWIITPDERYPSARAARAAAEKWIEGRGQ